MIAYMWNKKYNWIQVETKQIGEGRITATDSSGTIMYNGTESLWGKLIELRYVK